MCTASIRNISARSEETEFITAAMFKTFLDSHNKQMDTIQHSLDSLNSTYYDEYEDYDEEGDNSEDEPPRKITRSDTFVSVALGSGLTRSAVNSDPTCVPRVDKSKTRLGGSDGR